MKKFILLISTMLLMTSCSTTYKLSTLNHDPIYDTAGNIVDISIIDNEFELARKFRTDDIFRWNFARYAMNQDMRWQYDFYWNNRVYRRSPFNSPFSFYWNSHNYWWNWATNSQFYMGYNHWDPFGFNTYGWNSRYYGYGYGWNNGYYNWGWRNRMNNYAWENRNRTNVAYINGRRGSNIANYNNRAINNRVIINNKPRRSIDNSNVDRIIKDFKGKGLDVKIINNRNNDQINRSNPRGYGRPESSNNGGRSWSRENIPTKPTRSVIPSNNQPRQIRGGSRPPSIQQSRSSSTTSGQRSSIPRRQQ